MIFRDIIQSDHEWSDDDDNNEKEDNFLDEDDNNNNDEILINDLSNNMPQIIKSFYRVDEKMK